VPEMEVWWQALTVNERHYVWVAMEIREREREREKINVGKLK
jgi:hypothetical protein